MVGLPNHIFLPHDILSQPQAAASRVSAISLRRLLFPFILVSPPLPLSSSPPRPTTCRRLSFGTGLPPSPSPSRPPSSLFFYCCLCLAATSCCCSQLNVVESSPVLVSNHQSISQPISSHTPRRGRLPPVSVSALPARPTNLSCLSRPPGTVALRFRLDLVQYHVCCLQVPSPYSTVSKDPSTKVPRYHNTSTVLYVPYYLPSSLTAARLWSPACFHSSFLLPSRRRRLRFGRCRRLYPSP
jgi:hypothetical protein